MIELSVIRDLVTIFGVIAGFSYYVLTVRANQKNQRQAEQNRQLQTLNQMLRMGNEEGSKRLIELLNIKWDDYYDFEKKYGSDFNPDNYAKRTVSWNGYNYIGYAVKKGLIERDMVFDMFHITPLCWVKFGDVIKEIRKRYNQPLALQYFEYLAEECVKYMQEKGIDTTVPDTFFSYVPDQ